MRDTPPPRLFTLGRLALEDAEGGTIASAKFAKPLGLLAYLALAPGRRASRDRLVDLFWAHQTTDKARAALRQTLHRIRATMGSGILLDDGSDPVALAPGAWTDCTAFLDALAAGRNADAIELYGGPFVAGIVSAGSAAFEQWANLQRAHLQTHFLDAVEISARHDLDTGNHRGAHQLALRALDFEPLDQRLWRARLEAESRLFAPARRAISISELRQFLAESGAELEPRTIELIEHLDAEAGSDRPGYDPVVQGELVGRGDQFAALYRGWQQAHTGRTVCLHISAPPGLGKSRILADFRIRLAADRARVVPVRATPRQRELPWSAVADLANRLATLSGAPGISHASAEILVDLAPGLGGRFPDASPRLLSDREERRRARTEALHDLLASVLHEGPVVLLLDDLHWWDAESLAATAALVERAHDATLLVVTAARPPVVGFGGKAIELSPLSPEHVGEFIASIDHQEGADVTALVDTLWHATEGSPLLMTEAIQLGIAHNTIRILDGSLDFSEAGPFFGGLNPDTVLDDRIAKLPEEQRRALLLAATLGVAIPVSEEEPFPGAWDACHALEQRGLMTRTGDDLVIAHDRLAEAIDASMTEPERLRSHRDAATILGPVEGAPATARHLLAAGDHEELSSLVTEWIREQRRLGDNRAAHELVREILPEAAPEPVRDVVAALPFHLRQSTRAVMHATWGLVSLVGVLAAWQLASRNGPAPMRLEFDLIAASDTEETRYSHERITIILHGDRNNQGRPVVTRRPLPTPPITSLTTHAQPLIATPYGADSIRIWSIYNPPGDPDGPTSLILERAGQVEPVALAPGDDVHPSWSPDQQTIVFQTTRYPEGEGSFDLALFDPLTRTVTPLVVSPDIEESPHWSPDGMRIAYVRRPVDRGVDSLCWTALSGDATECLPMDGIAISMVMGWASLQTVYVTTVAPANQLLRIDLADGSRQTVLSYGQNAACSLSPDSEWFVCSRTLRTGSGPDGETTVYDLLGRLPQPIVLPFEASGDNAARVLWHHLPPVDHGTHLSLPAGSIRTMTGLSSRPAVTMRSPNGETWPVSPSLIRWSTSDSTIVTLDRNKIRGVRRGEAEVFAEAGKYRSEPIRVVVLPKSARSLFTERWDNDWRDRWTIFGEPEPRVVKVPDASPALLVDGDQEFDSGLIARAEFSPYAGVAADMWLTIPVTRGWWQHIWASLGIPNSTGDGFHANYCEARAPTAEGGPGSHTVAFGDLRVTGFDELLSGTPWQLRLQLFPDGSCGIAVNGKAVYRSSARTLRPDSVRLIIGGRSVGTTVLVGELTMWEGVPDGVDWDVIWR